MHSRALKIFFYCICCSSAAGAEPADSPVTALAERYVTLRLQYDPTLAYSTGLTAPNNVGLPDRTRIGLREMESREDEIRNEFVKLRADAVESRDQATRAVLFDMLESRRRLRVCRVELWDVNHFTGWQVWIQDMADQQPVGSSHARAAVLMRWKAIPSFLHTEISNLRTGLAAGYSMPGAVVQRVVGQLDKLIASAADESPFFSPARRDPDPKFRGLLATVVVNQIVPAIKDYREFLVKEYLPAARRSLGLSLLPDGMHCYQAFLRSWTTLDRTPAQIMELGLQTIAKNEATISSLGTELYGSADIATVIQRNNQALGNHFRSEKELLSYLQLMLRRARRRSGPLFLELPEQRVVIQPERIYLAGSGTAPHYDAPQGGSLFARYVIPVENWDAQTRGDAEITLVHETLPGHHLQFMLARKLQPTSRIAELADNSAYIEGWARYAETLAEESHIYTSAYARITRRAWQARGMVVDPGVHAFGWSREQATAYLLSTGRFTEATANETVDRIAALPGQLTAYDCGALEIVALRTEAQQALGSRFDIREFHQTVLEEGVVPMAELRRHVQSWIRGHSRLPH